MLFFSKSVQVVFQLSLGCFILGLVTAKTIDELIAGSSKHATDFDFMSDISGDQLRVELDMMMTVQQYQALYNKPSKSRSRSDSSRTKRKAIGPATYRWTDNRIPFVIDKSVFSDADMTEVYKAMDEWKNYTCITFSPARSSDSNFVSFEDGTGCSSYVGMNRGKHPIALAGGCRQKGVIAHEIGHAVGFYHEQNRPDRDDYITIQYDNIISPNLNHNFQKYPYSAVSTYKVPYDYTSIMHYGGRAFSGNGQYTIRTRNPAFQEVIGNREGLSFNDIKLANIMYSCNKKCDQNIVCPGDGFVGKDCQCVCRGSPTQKCIGTEIRLTTQHPTVKTSNRPTVKPTPMPCTDMNKYCQAWADAGYCLTNSYVQTYCKEACSLCSGGNIPVAQCRDLRAYCPQWKQLGHCTQDVYKAFMSEKCPKSCESDVCITRSKNEGTENNGQQIVSSILLIISTLISMHL
uniref:Metalloendopeptidase n=1 Tax=Arion vulgaris TaxID=1028688 RepID=A0A0B7A8H7_9EUPU